MFGKVLTASLAALIGIALAQPGINVEFKDNGFSYYSEYDANEIAEDELERTAYVRLWLDGNGVTVALADEPFEGAIAHTFSEVPEIDEDAEREIWGRRGAGDSFIAQRNLQETESERVHQLVGIDEHGLGWAITHGDAELTDVVEAYLGWLTEEGVRIEELDTAANAESYLLSTEGLSVRVRFSSVGDDVRVYFQ